VVTVRTTRCDFLGYNKNYKMDVICLVRKTR